MGGDRLGQPIVDFAAYANRQFGLGVGEHLDTGLNVREYLHVDARRVHETDALGADVAEPVLDGLVLCRRNSGYRSHTRG